MYSGLLKKLEDNTETNAKDEIWSLTLYSDGSGELIHPSESNLTQFNDLQDLTRYVDVLVNANKLLTVAACVELIMDSDREQ